MVLWLLRSSTIKHKKFRKVSCLQMPKRAILEFDKAIRYSVKEIFYTVMADDFWFLIFVFWFLIFVFWFLFSSSGKRSPVNVLLYLFRGVGPILKPFYFSFFSGRSERWDSDWSRHVEKYQNPTGGITERRSADGGAAEATLPNFTRSLEHTAKVRALHTKIHLNKRASIYVYIYVYIYTYI